jgi:hypothetical protein
MLTLAVVPFFNVCQLNQVPMGLNVRNDVDFMFDYVDCEIPVLFSGTKIVFMRVVGILFCTMFS